MKRSGEAGANARRPPGPVPPADEATEVAIAAYLKAHPDFVRRHPSVLQDLIPPSVDHGPGVVDFQRFMVERLQADIETLSIEKTALIHTARVNAKNQTRIHNAILALIEARSFGQMIEVLTGDLAMLLDVDAIVIAMESTANAVPYVAMSGIRLVEPGAIATWLGRRDVVLNSDIEGDPALYGPAAGLIASEAMLRLSVSPQTPVGLVAFGSRDPVQFQDGQGTEMIGFLGAVLERLIRGWLDLPS